jgi:predicted kinase
MDRNRASIQLVIMKRKLIVLSGVCGSGKSTEAKRIRDKDKDNTTIVKRDVVRRIWSDRSDDEITKIMIEIVGAYLRDRNGTVIVDACNLHPHDKARWEAVAWAFHVDLEWIYLLTPIETCIERDRQREDPVGEDRIRAQGELDVSHLNIVAAHIT